MKTIDLWISVMLMIVVTVSMGALVQ